MRTPEDAMLETEDVWAREDVAPVGDATAGGGELVFDGYNVVREVRVALSPVVLIPAPAAGGGA